MHRGSRYLVGRTALRSLCFSSERRAGYNDFKTLTVAEPVEAVFKVPNQLFIWMYNDVDCIP